jgi:hypothetical protein
MKKNYNYIYILAILFIMFIIIMWALSIKETLISTIDMSNNTLDVSDNLIFNDNRNYYKFI